MDSNNNMFTNVGLNIPRFLLPSGELDRWAVVACDQFSSQPDYWKKCEALVANSPSTLNIIYPEAYYETDKDKSVRINAIAQAMEKYKTDGTLQSVGDGFIYVERTLLNGKIRRGLVAMVDLDHYEFAENAKTMIRPTEGTIIERIPPRKAIRSKATLDLSHILMLIDDPKDDVFGVIEKNKEQLSPLYDFDLMMKGGRIQGSLISDNGVLAQLAKAFESLKAKSDLLFAVGDGNHSLATAKSVWEDIKPSVPESKRANHPARWALAEIGNIHDEGMEFEPIHRVLFDVDKKSFLEAVAKDLPFEAKEFSSLKEAHDAELKSSAIHKVTLCFEGGAILLESNVRPDDLTSEPLQEFLDDYLKKNASVRIDYIHGEDSTVELGTGKGNLGMLLPDIDKFRFFPLILQKGRLPRKTFSIGEAEEKRCYIETRSLTVS